MQLVRKMSLLIAALLPPQLCAAYKDGTAPALDVQVQVDAQGAMSGIKPVQPLKEPCASRVRRADSEGKEI